LRVNGEKKPEKDILKKNWQRHFKVRKDQEKKIFKGSPIYENDERNELNSV
jgi:hypothetical protein